MLQKNQNRFRFLVVFLVFLSSDSIFGGPVLPGQYGGIQSTDGSTSHSNGTDFKTLSGVRVRPQVEEQEEPPLSDSVRSILTNPPQNEFALMEALSELASEDKKTLSEFLGKQVEAGSNDNEHLDQLRFMVAVLDGGENLRNKKVYPNLKALEDFASELIRDAQRKNISENERAYIQAERRAVFWEIQRRRLEEANLLGSIKAAGGIKSFELRGNGTPGMTIVLNKGGTLLVSGAPSSFDLTVDGLLTIAGLNTLRLARTLGPARAAVQMGKAAAFGGGLTAGLQVIDGVEQTAKGKIQSWSDAGQWLKKAALNTGAGALGGALIGPGVANSRLLQAAVTPVLAAKGAQGSWDLLEQGRPLTAAANFASTAVLDLYLLGAFSGKRAPSSRGSAGSSPVGSSTPEVIPGSGVTNVSTSWARAVGPASEVVPGTGVTNVGPASGVIRGTGVTNVGPASGVIPGTGRIEVTGPFDSAYQMTRAMLESGLLNGTINPGRRTGMLALYYPSSSEATPTFGISLNLRPGKVIEPGDLAIYSPKALAQIAEGRATTVSGSPGRRWNEPGGCAECMAIRKAGEQSPGGMTISFFRRQIEHFGGGESRRTLELDYHPTPQCRSCETLGVRDVLGETTTSLQVFEPNSSTFFNNVTPQWMQTYWNSP